MNFIGHATVALWQRAEPEFVLGSMLPDFAGMAGTRLLTRAPETPVDGAEPSLAHAPEGSLLHARALAHGTAQVDPSARREAALRAGIALHHRTDDVFHGAPVFVTLLQETLDELTGLGIARGSARAVAHVGVEMFIDGELVREPEVASAYTRALHAGGGFDHLFVDRAGATRWELLRQRLIVYGAPYDYRDPDSVLTRLQLMLRARPRLAIDTAALPVLRQALPGLQRKVIAELSALLATLRADLS